MAEYAHKLNQLAQHLNPLIQFALSKVPAEFHSQTPFLFYATAGMRLLAVDEQRTLLRAVYKYLHSNSPFLVKESRVSMISGEQEGIYGWLTVNYLMDTFLLNQGTLGFVDMGGASSQLTFATSDSKKKKVFSIGVKSLAGEVQHYQVFSASILGSGVNQAFEHHLLLLLLLPRQGVNEEEGVVENPCLNKDLVLERKKVRFKGTGNYYQCRSVLLPLLKETFGSSSFLTNQWNYQGNHHFIGVSEFWYIAEEILGPYFKGGAYNAADFDQAAQRFCQKSWKLGGGEKRKEQCFKAAWLSVVIHHGYGIPRDTLRPLLLIKNEVNKFELSWALGAVLLEEVFERIDAPGLESAWTWMVGGGVQGGLEETLITRSLHLGCVFLLFLVAWTLWIIWRIRRSLSSSATSAMSVMKNEAFKV